MTDHSPYLQAIHALTSSIRRLRDNPLSVHAPDYTTTDVLACIDTLVVCAQREMEELAADAAPPPRYSYVPPAPAPVVMQPLQYMEVWGVMQTSKVSAIKLCRSYSGVGLVEAKNYVEAMMSRAADESYVPEPDAAEVDEDLPF